MIKHFFRHIKWLFFFYYASKKNKYQWRRLNIHNNTTISKIVKDISIIEVGIETYGEINVYSFNNKHERLIIGSYVSIGPNVFFILGGNHQLDTFSSFPLKSRLIKSAPEYDATTKGVINVEDEVWIGANVTILSGLKIGMGAIIAAGSVVTKDVPSFAIVAGNPAKFVKWRIPQNLIARRNKFKLSQFSNKILIQNIDLFYKKLDESVLDEIDKVLFCNNFRK